MTSLDSAETRERGTARHRKTTTPPAGRDRARLDSLTGLRFFAALSVFVSHSSSPVFPTFADPRAQAGFNTGAGALGGLGVSFFFILSGFVLAWSARPAERPAGFYRRRFVKILPLYYVVGAAAAVLLWGAGTRWQDLLAYASLTQVWLPNPQVNFAVLAPGWSLAVEAVFYLVFPFVIGAFRRLGRRAAWTGLALCVAGAFLVPVLAYTLPAATLVGESNAAGFPMWFAYVFPLGRLCDFFAGIFAALLMAHHRFPHVSLPWVLLSFVPCYLVASQAPMLFGWRAPLLIPSVLLIVAAAQRDVTRRPTFLSSRPMVTLGNASFAFYLCHYLVLYTLNTTLHGPFESPAVVSAYLASALAASLTLAWLLYRYVELPIVRRFGTSDTRL